MATAVETKTLFTAEQFLKLDLGEGSFELVRGEVVPWAPPMPEHGRVCFNAGFVLEVYGRQTGFGYVLSNDSPVRTERGPDTLRGADICFYSHARWPRAEVQNTVPPIPPDLVVEVDSPGNRPGRMRAKVHEYLEVGVLLVWVIHPTRLTVSVYRPEEIDPTTFGQADVLEGFAELPGFRCEVADFFL